RSGKLGPRGRRPAARRGGRTAPRGAGARRAAGGRRAGAGRDAGAGRRARRRVDGRAHIGGRIRRDRRSAGERAGADVNTNSGGCGGSSPHERPSSSGGCGGSSPHERPSSSGGCGGSSPHESPVRVVIVDDQGMVRAGFGVLLNAQPDIEVVGEAVNGEEGVRRVAELRPDVVLMDVRMPVMDGLEATRRILGDAGDDAPKVLMLTTFDLDDYVYEALRAGASGFLLKDASATELADAVRVVAAGDALLSPSVTRRLIAEFSRLGGR